MQTVTHGLPVVQKSIVAVFRHSVPYYTLPSERFPCLESTESYPHTQSGMNSCHFTRTFRLLSNMSPLGCCAAEGLHDMPKLALYTYHITTQVLSTCFHHTYKKLEMVTCSLMNCHLMESHFSNLSGLTQITSSRNDLVQVGAEFGTLSSPQYRVPLHKILYQIEGQLCDKMAKPKTTVWNHTADLLLRQSSRMRRRICKRSLDGKS